MFKNPGPALQCITIL